MLHDPQLMQRLHQAKIACITRMHMTAEWLEQADLSDRAALGHCGHRLAGTLASFSFADAAKLASRLERACDLPGQMLDEHRTALVAALRNLQAR